MDHDTHPLLFPFGIAERNWTALFVVRHQILMSQNCKMTWGACNSLRIRIYAIAEKDTEIENGHALNVQSKLIV